MIPIPMPRLSSGQGGGTLRMIVGWLAIPFDVLLRHSYGPAYFSFTRLLGFLFALWLYANLLTFRANFDFLLGYGAIGYGVASPFMALFGLLVLIGGMLQLRQMGQRAQTGRMIYPDSVGISRFYLGQHRYRFDSQLPGYVQLSHWRVYRFVDPLLAFGIAFVVSQFDGVIGSFLMFSAFCLLARNQMVHGAEQEEFYSWQRRRIRHEVFERQLQSPDLTIELDEYGGYVPSWLPPTQRQAFAQDQIALAPASAEVPVITSAEEPDELIEGITRPQFTPANTAA